VNNAMPAHQRKLGMKVRQSNLCSEIMLHTGRDHLGEDRTAVCCLSSLNAETFDEWKDHPTFIEDVFRFLDNVLEDFIQRAPDEMRPATYSAFRERSVGLGLMGFHSFLQAKGVPFESAMAKSWNMRMFKHIRTQADQASVKLAHERGPCPDAADNGVMARFTHKLAIAPTASISIICGGTCRHRADPGQYLHPQDAVGLVRGEESASGKGAEAKRHEHREDLVLDPRTRRLGPASGRPDGRGKGVFKTAFELDQRWVIELAADRTPYICQGQSLNVFIPGDVDKWDLHMLHWRAWETGVKSLYYCRSKSVQRAQMAGTADKVKEATGDLGGMTAEKTDYDECLACQ
jgi:ribonucleoside-diphosphate reductase alpha chain